MFESYAVKLPKECNFVPESGMYLPIVANMNRWCLMWSVNLSWVLADSWTNIDAALADPQTIVQNSCIDTAFMCEYFTLPSMV
jgi:hypothetical protein